MNKTVTINLAGLLFHIDEDAYQKLQEYLNALKRAYANEAGAEEIISDIEARIAELFNEAKLHELQVIDIKNVDDAIAIMGQPEDLFDEEPSEPADKEEKFTEAQEETQKKQLYRDTSEAYVSGVSAGLGHYLAVDALWIRLAWIFLVFFSGGTFILLYISLWFFVPEAKTTAEKLAMKGKPVNVSNIEAKIKEGINNVSDTVKNAYNSRNKEEIRNTTTQVFTKLEILLKGVLRFFGAFIGLIIILISGAGLLSLIGAALGITAIGLVDSNDFLSDVYGSVSIPYWLGAITFFFLTAVPLIFLFLLGLKITFRKVKNISKSFVLTLAGIWIVSLITFIVLQIYNERREKYTATWSNTEKIPVTEQDTLYIKMRKNERYISNYDFNRSYNLREDENGEKVLVSQNLKIYIKTSDIEEPHMKIEKIASGLTYNLAQQTAQKINYDYKIEKNELILDAFALSNYEDDYSNQKVKIILFLPKNTVLYADSSTKAYNNRKKSDNGVTIKYKENHYLKLNTNKVSCLDCENEEYSNDNDDNFNIDLDLNFDDENFEDQLEEKIERFIENNIDEENDKLDINGKDFNIKINENGIQINTSESLN